MTKNLKKLIVTGGCGFIGTALIDLVLKQNNFKVLNIDKIYMTSNLLFHNNFLKNKNYDFKKIDICNKDKTLTILEKFRPDFIIHLAAETHVDKSIENPYRFVKNNIEGTFNLFECCRKYLKKISGKKRDNFKILYVSTDEVFGSLGEDGFFDEKTKYNPSSPYSASKASADHLATAYYKTYNLPILTSNCSNNYGPFQLPEKLIPLMIIKAIRGDNLPIYGDGSNIRDWLYVYDHVEALLIILRNGKIGNSYNVGGNNEISNLNVVKNICNILSNIKDHKKIKFKSFEEQCQFVQDRPGHDKRYAINFKKLKSELGWMPKETFKTGLKKTIMWYLENYIYNKQKLSINKNILKRQGLVKL